MNFKQLFQLMGGNANPQQFIMNIMENQMRGTPLGNNIIELAKRNDIAGLENIARNLCAPQGLDYEKEMANFRKTLGQ